MNINKLIDYFKVAPTDGKKIDVMDCISKCARYGYIPQPECCTQEVLNYVESKDWNPNSTFYKTWSDITEKSRFELFIDQLIHYASTYGTDFKEESYIPNHDPIKINYNTYTVIEAIEPTKLAEKCFDLLKSGIALSSDMVVSCVDWIEHCFVEYDWGFDASEIKNREAMTLICKRFNIFPAKGQDMILYFLNLINGATMLVQSHRDISMIKERIKYHTRCGANPVDLGKLTEKQMIELAKVFYRYKKFLLTLRYNNLNRQIINKIRRMAPKYHSPMRMGFWEGLTSWTRDYVDLNIDNELEKLDNPFKIVRLIQMLNIRQKQNQNRDNRVFFIRNGKTYVKDAYPSMPLWLLEVKNKLRNRLVKLVRPQVEGKFIKFPENIVLTVPVSEKKFFGNIPFGSYAHFADADNFFGVYWRNEWGTRDFDISFVDKNGYKIGWNAGYNSHGIVFSGDMTNADPEATEMFYIKKGMPDGTIYLNRYHGSDGSKYQLFFGQQHIKNLKLNYMVDPNNISLRVDGVSDSAQQIVGQVYNNKIYFLTTGLGNTRVSNKATNELSNMLDSYMDLKELLLNAGARIWTEELAAEAAKIDKTLICDLDLSNFTKDKIIGCLVSVR